MLPLGEAGEGRIAIGDGFHGAEIIVPCQRSRIHAVVIRTQRIIPVHMHNASTAGRRRN